MQAIMEILAQFSNEHPDFEPPDIQTESIDKILRDLLSKTLADGGEKKYDHYRFLNLLSDASDLLDRCLLKRVAHDDLVREGADRALQLYVAKSAQSYQQVLLEADWVKSIRDAEQSGHAEAAQKFIDANNAGFAETSKTWSRASGLASAGEAKKLIAAKALGDSQAEYLKILERLRFAEDGVFNFRQRSDRILSLLREDFVEAVEKMQAARIGLARVYGSNGPGPELDSPRDKLVRNRTSAQIDSLGILDLLVLWLRDRIQWLELSQLDELDWVSEIKFSQADAASTGWPSANNGRDRPTVLINLSKYPFLAGARVTGICVSLTLRDGQSGSDGKDFRAPCLVAVFPEGNGKFDRRAEIALDATPMDASRGPQWITSPEIQNISPRNIWRFKFEEKVEHYVAGRVSDWSAVSDVTFHILYRAQRTLPSLL